MGIHTSIHPPHNTESNRIDYPTDQHNTHDGSPHPILNCPRNRVYTRSSKCPLNRSLPSSPSCVSHPGVKTCLSKDVGADVGVIKWVKVSPSPTSHDTENMLKTIMIPTPKKYYTLPHTTMERGAGAPLRADPTHYCPYCKNLLDGCKEAGDETHKP